MVFSCCKCGDGIQDGEKYYDSPDGYVCEGCIPVRYRGYVGRRIYGADWRNILHSGKGGMIIWQNSNQQYSSRLA